MAKDGKKTQMQEEVEKTETGQGEQMDLLDVQPENVKEIIKHARLYKVTQKKRLKALADEIKQKEKLLDLIDEAKLQRREDGKIKFKCDVFTITVTPRDELIQIKEKSEDDVPEE